MSRKSHDFTLDAWVHKLPFWGLIVLAAVAFAILILLVNAPPAKAQDERWAQRLIWRTYCNSDQSHCYRRQAWVRAYQPRVYAYERRYDDERWERRDPQSERGVQCKDTAVRVIGRKHLTVPAATKDAVGAWESSIGYDFGEKFANMENARGYRWRCDKASTNETTIGRAAAAVGDALSGGTADTYYKRCVVTHLPDGASVPLGGAAMGGRAASYQRASADACVRHRSVWEVGGVES